LILTSKQRGIRALSSRSSSTGEHVSCFALPCDHLMVSSCTLFVDLVHGIKSLLIFKFARVVLR
jgi:hypothetical protein